MEEGLNTVEVLNSKQCQIIQEQAQENNYIQHVSLFSQGLNAFIPKNDIIESIKRDLLIDSNVECTQININKRNYFMYEIKILPENLGIVYGYLCNHKFSEQNLKPCYSNSMRSTLISNIPKVVSEKDLFLILRRMTPEIQNICIADHAQLPGLTLGICSAKYSTFEKADLAIKQLNNKEIMGNVLSCHWLPYNIDVIQLLQQASSDMLFVQNIIEIFKQYGEITSLRKYNLSFYIQMRSCEEASLAYAKLQDQKIDGLKWNLSFEKTPCSPLLPDDYKQHRNSAFSKNFLDESDQNKILNFALTQAMPVEHDWIQTQAQSIVQQAHTVQRNQLDILKANLLKLEQQKEEEILEQRKKAQLQQQASLQQQNILNVLNPQNMLQQKHF